MKVDKSITGITWSSLELEGLVEDEDSHVYLEKHIKHIGLHPFHLTNLHAALHEILSSNLNSYDSEFEGFLLAYRNPKFLSPIASIVDDACFIHIDIEIEVFIFRPEVGCMLRGIVSKKGITHLGVLVHKAFNVSIFNDNEWPKEKIKIGHEIKFEVTRLDFCSKLPFISGSLNENNYLDGCKLPLESETGSDDENDFIKRNLNQSVSMFGNTNFAINNSCNTGTDSDDAKNNLITNQSLDDNETKKKSKKRKNKYLEDEEDIKTTTVLKNNSKLSQEIDSEDEPHSNTNLKDLAKSSNIDTEMCSLSQENELYNDANIEREKSKKHKKLKVEEIKHNKNSVEIKSESKKLLDESLETLSEVNVFKSPKKHKSKKNVHKNVEDNTKSKTTSEMIKIKMESEQSDGDRKKKRKTSNNVNLPNEEIFDYTKVKVKKEKISDSESEEKNKKAKKKSKKENNHESNLDFSCVNIKREKSVDEERIKEKVPNDLSNNNTPRKNEHKIEYECTDNESKPSKKCHKKGKNISESNINVNVKLENNVACNGTEVDSMPLTSSQIKIERASSKSPKKHNQLDIQYESIDQSTELRKRERKESESPEKNLKKIKKIKHEINS